MTTALMSLEPADGPDLPPLIGESPALVAARSQLARFAGSHIPVLLVGPTGAGKDVLARHLHGMSRRRGRMIDVNCGALPRDMIESLLFGHRRGAFTGAVESSTGFIALADAGTLFLDELASLPVEGQAKLLRVLETGELTPLGSTVKKRVDFRLVSAAQDDLFARIESHQFRRDLFHRVEGVTIHLPALRERPEDIPPLATHFARVHGRSLEPEAFDVLLRQGWPGNVRQLRTVLERASLLSDGPSITAKTVCDALGVARNPSDTLRQQERERLIAICVAEGDDAARISAALGVSRATLYRRLKEHGLRLRGLSASLTSLMDR